MGSPHRRTYRVSDSLGSLLEVYILDGISEDDPMEEPELVEARRALCACWDRAGGKLVVPDHLAAVLSAGVNDALNSLDGEPRRGPDAVRAQVERSGTALYCSLNRQAYAARGKGR